MKVFTLIILILGVVPAMSQRTINLYMGEIPNSKPSGDKEKWEEGGGIMRVSEISRPTLMVFLPPNEKANGTAVIICPGGGYWINAIQHEGIDLAKKLNEWGVAAFVLKYRIPNEATMIDKSTGPAQDAFRAVQLVRENAKEWNIDPDRVGMMGFSAGGHLASTAGTAYYANMLDNPKQTNLGPSFLILVYPVITFKEPLAHMGSREQLIGRTVNEDLIDLFSSEVQVNETTPPTFLVHASDDDAVSAQNSILFYQALQRSKIPAELHLYQKGGHGFGMNNKTTRDSWVDRLQNWMDANGWLK
jgi:acetyl esterase/lipase